MTDNKMGNQVGKLKTQYKALPHHRTVLKDFSEQEQQEFAKQCIYHLLLSVHSLEKVCIFFSFLD